MKVLALLRGVMPTGPNKIPKMADLVEILEESGFENVSTYIQSGNVLLDNDLPPQELALKIHNVILDEIGANLPIVIKIKENLKTAINENPFDESYDFSRIHLVFTNSILDSAKIEKLNNTVFEGEIFKVGTECFYMYLPRDSAKKRLNNNYLEKHLSIVATTRKLSVITKLHNMLDTTRK
ncbi:MAG: DUF1697 domain-containing protein [Sarcina sp.]